MTDQKSDLFTDWIFNSFRVTPEGLALYRIFAALFMLCFLLPPASMYEFAASLPPDFFSPPPGLMWLFGDFPGEAVFWTLHSLLILTLLGMLVGYKTGFMSVSAGLLLLVIKGFIYSVGKINHEMLLIAVPILMAFSGWGAAWSVDSWLKDDKSRETSGWPLTLLALIVGFMMFTAGFTKLLGGWLNPETQAVLGHFFNQYFVKGRSDLLARSFLAVDSRTLWELLDYLTVLFEIGFLAAVLRPYTTRIFVSLAVLFHFSTMMMLNISFLHNFVAYAAFINWNLVYRKLRTWTSQTYAPPLVLGAGVLLVQAGVGMGGLYRFPVLESDLTIADLYVLALALPVALTYLGYTLYPIFSRLLGR